jgi:hypothetical protein
MAAGEGSVEPRDGLAEVVRVLPAPEGGRGGVAEVRPVLAEAPSDHAGAGRQPSRPPTVGSSQPRSEPSHYSGRAASAAFFTSRA